MQSNLTDKFKENILIKLNPTILNTSHSPQTSQTFKLLEKICKHLSVDM